MKDKENTDNEVRPLFVRSVAWYPKIEEDGSKPGCHKAVYDATNCEITVIDSYDGFVTVSTLHKSGKVRKMNRVYTIGELEKSEKEVSMQISVYDSINLVDESIRKPNNILK